METTLTGDAGAKGRRGVIAAIGMPARSVMELFEGLTTDIM